MTTKDDIKLDQCWRLVNVILQSYPHETFCFVKGFYPLLSLLPSITAYCARHWKMIIRCSHIYMVSGLLWGDSWVAVLWASRGLLAKGPCRSVSPLFTPTQSSVFALSPFARLW
jgi:hypothetical protein